MKIQIMTERQMVNRQPGREGRTNEEPAWMAWQEVRLGLQRDEMDRQRTTISVEVVLQMQVYFVTNPNSTGGRGPRAAKEEELNAVAMQNPPATGVDG